MFPSVPKPKDPQECTLTAVTLPLVPAVGCSALRSQAGPPEAFLLFTFVPLVLLPGEPVSD